MHFMLSLNEGTVMSSISLGGISPSLYTYLQGVNSTKKTSQSAPTPPVTTAEDSDGDSDGSSSSTQATSTSRQHDGGAFFQAIQSAVASALQTAQSSSLTTNPNQVIQSAIAQVLKTQQNGAESNSGQTSVAANDPDGDGDTDAPGVADSDTSNTQTVFAQLLQSNGVNAQQFQNDFRAAIQSARSGVSAIPGSVFSGFPTGSTLDVVG
jgi:hypothetical protein